MRQRWCSSRPAASAGAAAAEAGSAAATAAATATAAVGASGRGRAARTRGRRRRRHSAGKRRGSPRRGHQQTCQLESADRRRWHDGGWDRRGAGRRGKISKHDQMMLWGRVQIPRGALPPGMAQGATGVRGSSRAVVSEGATGVRGSSRAVVSEGDTGVRGTAWLIVLAATPITSAERETHHEALNRETPGEREGPQWEGPNGRPVGSPR